ncbi:MAG: hypothetical protein IT297_05985 [Anaerolineae bacterium]|jgi:hypothetical protein|nr:hypothetical protein [Anaerolineae bacterium]MCZ7551619.1 hypothetical protein [Anaerolineales bacterium]
MQITQEAEGKSSLRWVFNAWWPLAASWMLMGMEAPLMSAVIARLAEPEINMASYSGVVFPLALIVESPIIMLLAASTALSKDLPSYQLLRKYMLSAGALLTGLHVLVAFTPLYYIVVAGIMGAQPEIIEPARVGLMIMTPWTWSIAYRRFNQGVLIRFGRSKSVGMGTMVRLSANIVVLAIGFSLGSLPGIVIGSAAVASGVMAEALYVSIVVRPVLREELRLSPIVEPPLTWRFFWGFYIPLMLTSLLTLLANPIASAAINRLPLAIESLAIWLVITGLIFILRALGIAFNEVVVALLDTPGAYLSLRRFTILLALVTTGLLLAIAATPLAQFWFRDIFALRPELVLIAQRALWLALPLPALSVLQSWYQGTILNDGATRGITESVVVYLLTSVVVLGFGIWHGKIIGLYIGLSALTLSVATQTFWLWLRARRILSDLGVRDRPPEGIAQFIEEMDA